MSVSAIVENVFPLIQFYFIESAKRYIREDIASVELLETQTKQRAGASGALLISDITYQIIDAAGQAYTASKKIAIKFVNDHKAALTEMRNSLNLENSFLSFPLFGTPKVIFASTQDPIFIVYEGVQGTNYDECSADFSKAYHAGRLLAVIHGRTIKNVDSALYQNLVRMISQHLSLSGKEAELSRGLTLAFEKFKGATSGCNPFSDFHQSNVMINAGESIINKMYVIDPEFMQKGNFDRMEDAGTFFGNQFLNEYINTQSIRNSSLDLSQFILGYDNVFHNLTTQHLYEIYPNGLPIQFTIALWALMDALDIITNRDTHSQVLEPEIMIRIEFALYILNNEELENLLHLKRQ